jgi:D-sedoheptulose 7-phosphate isomerase
VPTFAERFLNETAGLVEQLDRHQVEAVVDVLAATRARGGRLFLSGSGGGAGHASHAACDFRKLCDIESYAVTDNVSELTARVNDEGWDTSYANWLRASRLGAGDCLFVFSVGGGDVAHGISVNLVNAMNLARERGASVTGVAGRDGGELARAADACVVIPAGDAGLVTPQTEGIQAVVWHLIVSHPKLAANASKWESVTVPTSGGGAATGP